MKKKALLNLAAWNTGYSAGFVESALTGKMWVMDVLFAFLIVLLFGALPTQPYSASGRAHYPAQADAKPRMNAPKPRPWQFGYRKFAITNAGNGGQDLGDNWLPDAREPRMNPPKGIFETEVDAIEWKPRSQFDAKWKAAVRDGL